MKSNETNYCKYVVGDPPSDSHVVLVTETKKPKKESAKSPSAGASTSAQVTPKPANKPGKRTTFNLPEPLSDDEDFMTVQLPSRKNYPTPLPTPTTSRNSVNTLEELEMMHARYQRATRAARQRAFTAITIPANRGARRPEPIPEYVRRLHTEWTPYMVTLVILVAVGIIGGTLFYLSHH